MLDYRPTAIAAVVGFEGGEPGVLGCGFAIAQQQVDIHGSLAAAADFHGYDDFFQLLQAIAIFCNG